MCRVQMKVKADMSFILYVKPMFAFIVIAPVFCPKQFFFTSHRATAPQLRSLGYRGHWP